MESVLNLETSARVRGVSGFSDRGDSSGMEVRDDS